MEMGGGGGGGLKMGGKGGGGVGKMGGLSRNGGLPYYIEVFPEIPRIAV